MSMQQGLGRELAGLGVRVAGDEGGGRAVAAVGGDARATRDAVEADLVADAAVRAEQLRLVGAGERAAARDADAAGGDRVDPLAEPAGRAPRAPGSAARRRGQLAEVRGARRLVERAEDEVRAGELARCVPRGAASVLRWAEHGADDRARRPTSAQPVASSAKLRAATTHRRAPRACGRSISGGDDERGDETPPRTTSTAVLRPANVHSAPKPTEATKRARFVAVVMHGEAAAADVLVERRGRERGQHTVGRRVGRADEDSAERPAPAMPPAGSTQRRVDRQQQHVAAR